MRPCEALALAIFIYKLDGTILGSHCPKIARWAWLCLPNGQVAKSRWKETQKPLNKVWMSRNVKVSCAPHVYMFKLFNLETISIVLMDSVKFTFTFVVRATDKIWPWLSFQCIPSLTRISSCYYMEPLETENYWQWYGH
jgi:hypothetical protein